MFAFGGGNLRVAAVARGEASRREAGRAAAGRGEPAGATHAHPWHPRGRAGHPRRGAARSHVRRRRLHASEHARRGHGGGRRRGHRAGRRRRVLLLLLLLLLLLVLLLELQALALERRLALLERRRRCAGGGGGLVRGAHQVLRAEQVRPAPGRGGEVGRHLRVRDRERAREEVAHVAARGDIHLLHRALELERGWVIFEVAAELLAVVDGFAEEPRVGGLLLRPAEKAAAAARSGKTRGRARGAGARSTVRLERTRGVG